MSAKMPAPTSTATRALTVEEIETVSGGLTLSVATLERIALQQKLTEAYLSHQESRLGDAIKDRFHL